MMYALGENNEKILPEPNKRGICSLCNQVLISKCGDVNIWHWSHKNKSNCDSWFENETEWHRSWKELLINEVCEVKVENHFADIKLPEYTRTKKFKGVVEKSLVIELQHSPISDEVVSERESFYGNMFWLFDAREFKIEFREDISPTKKTFRWKYPHKSLKSSFKPLFFDLGNGLIFRVEKLIFDKYCGGYGKIIPKFEFIKTYFYNYLKDGR